MTASTQLVYVLNPQIQKTETQLAAAAVEMVPWWREYTAAPAAGRRQPQGPPHTYGVVPMPICTFPDPGERCLNPTRLALGGLFCLTLPGQDKGMSQVTRCLSNGNVRGWLLCD